MQNADKNSSTKPIISQESDFQGHRFLLLYDDMGANADKFDCRNPSSSVCFSLGLQNPGIATCVLKAAASKSLYREQERKSWQQKSSLVQKQMLNLGSPVLIFHSINTQASRLEQRFPSYNTQLEILSHSTKQIGKMHLTRLQQQNCSSPNLQPAFQIQALLGTSLEEAELQILKQIGIERERDTHTHTHTRPQEAHSTHNHNRFYSPACMHVCVCERERERVPEIWCTTILWRDYHLGVHNLVL